MSLLKGSWIDSARKYKLNDNILYTELKNYNGEWIKGKYKINLKYTYYNDNGILRKSIENKNIITINNDNNNHISITNESQLYNDPYDPDFDWIIYRELNPVLIVNGLSSRNEITEHWNNIGKHNGLYKNIPNFDIINYIKNSPDLNLPDILSYQVNYIKNNYRKKKYIYLIEHGLGGGLSKYVKDLISYFPNILKDYNDYDIYVNTLIHEHHILVAPNFPQSLDKLNDIYESGILHINILPFYKTYDVNKFNELLDIFKKYSTMKVFITLHDLFWLYPHEPNLKINEMYFPSNEHIDIIQKIFSHCSKLIIPTMTVKNIYERYGINFDLLKHTIVPHIDISTNCINPYYQFIHDEIRVIFIGLFVHYKGSDTFNKLSAIKHFKNLNIKYFICGEEYDKSLPDNNIIKYGKYDNNQQLLNMVNNIKPHLILLLSDFYETYSYVTSISLYTGIPLFYHSLIYQDRLNYRKNTNIYSYDLNNIYDQYNYCLEDILKKSNKEFKSIQVNPEIAIPNEYYSYIEDAKLNINNSFSYLTQNLVKPFAIYFPQFHEIEENNINFYNGFNDIINLDKLIINNRAYQSDTPLLSYIGSDNICDYNLVHNTQLIDNQIALAKEYNIAGFAMYYYWFSINTITNSNMIMKNVIDKFFEKEYNNFKIFFVWANENWTDNPAFGNSNHQIKNIYDTNSFINNIKNLMIYFKHENYLKIDNKPIISIHHPWFMKDDEIDIFYSILESNCKCNGFNGVELLLNNNFKLYQKYKNYSFNPNYKNPHYSSCYSNNTLDYQKYITSMQTQINNSSDIQTLFYSFDNSARLFEPNKLHLKTVLSNNNDYNIQIYNNNIIKAYDITTNRSEIEKILLINSWNEWGENMAIEPSNEKYYYYLKHIKQLLQTSI